MDANESESTVDITTGSAAERMKRNLSDKAQNMKESLNSFGRKTANRIDDSREPTANALARTAKSLHSRTDKMSQLAHSRTDKASQLAHSAADRIQVGADYLREHDVEQILDDVRTLVKKYPGRSLAAAAMVGFVIARVLQRPHD